jgi:hypothetical protein
VQNLIYPAKSVWFVIYHSPGARNGKNAGMKSNTAPIAVVAAKIKNSETA